MQKTYRLFILITLFIFKAESIFSRSIILNSDWQFRNVKEDKWYKAAVPGTVHTDLLANHLIPDPFYRDNEKKVQWVSLQEWEYKTSFDFKHNFSQSPEVFLQFEGLDTYADVYLNDKLILKAENMFRTYRVKVDNLFQKKNTLRILFRSAEILADSMAKESHLVYPCENNRNWVRKAQFNFGWDWAPRFITCGIWRNAKLIFNDTETNTAPTPQYSDVKLIQETDSIGQSFYFTVNGKPTFMKGANWIPADVFLPRISKEKYRSLLIAAKDAHMNMLRVWGGGIYEDDYFYDLCDSLGIYIWQDFMFAGAMYPANEQSLENIKQEAIDNIIRLRKHKCIVLWCGNNEIDEAWHNWGWQKQFGISANDSTALWLEYKKIFHELLPSLVKQYDSGRTYIASSPLYGWGRQQSMTHGDSHFWGMWWGLEPVSAMQKKIPRFMSEYGMQAMPDMETIKQFSHSNEMDTSSDVIKTHQKHPTGFQTLTKYLEMENIPVSDFKSFVEGTQELQSRAIETALKAQLNSHGRCMGSLVWQLNDCWPVCSWSIIDYYGRKKKAYYTMQKILKQ